MDYIGGEYRGGVGTLGDGERRLLCDGSASPPDFVEIEAPAYGHFFETSLEIGFDVSTTVVGVDID